MGRGSALHDAVDGGSVSPECLGDNKVDAEADGGEQEEDVAVCFSGREERKELLKR